MSNKVYTARISPSHGKVYVEISYLSDTHCSLLSERLSYVHIYKYFGSVFNSAPTESDYIRAKKWAKYQLDLIKNHSTYDVDYPEILTKKTYNYDNQN